MNNKMYFDSCENETKASDEKKEREDNKDKIFTEKIVIRKGEERREGR